MISVVTPQEIIQYCRSILGVQTPDDAFDDVFLASMLRRAAGALCPCSCTVLRNALTESLCYMADGPEPLQARLDTLIDELVVTGDLLELSDVTTGDLETKGTWVFAAPPAFIERKSGSVFLVGIVPDQDQFLSKGLADRIEFFSTTRLIKPRAREDLAAQLLSEGLTALPEATWLKAPRTLRVAETLSKARQSLAGAPQCRPIQGLEIIDPATKVTFYRGRWTTPKGQSGMFVARRPQEFGAALWCLAELDSGVLVRLIDLPLGNYRWRGCDAAWHLQMAIDAERHEPQRYSSSNGPNGTRRIDFFSPIPLWAERRLLILGRKRAGDKSLFAYELPAGEAPQEETFLQQNLWLSPVHDSSHERIV